jgi:tetratricopeptide (TPR) repeat protein/transcriptional regulator with XRE-family HTH domain
MSARRDRLSGPQGTVRVRRIQAGLTQEQLAEMSGLSVRTISDIECGRTARPRRSSVALLEAVLSQAGSAGDRPPGTGQDTAGGQDPALSSPVPRQLPRMVRGFIGRAVELKALTEFLPGQETADGTGVIAVIDGTAGVGKTALALRWAHEVAERFPDGQLFANLRGYDPDRPLPAADALAGLLLALGVPGRDIPSGTDERAALYRSLLAGRRMLVLLDNAGEAEQVRPLLPGTPTCLTVVTSRDALAGLVARDGAARMDLDLLPPADAAGLLRVLIGTRADADPDATETLAEQCSRLPLALRVAAELAAARPDVALADLVRELGDEQQRLDLLDAGGDPRSGVSAVFSWSYRRLDPAAARTFRLLGLHPGLDLDRYAVASLTGSSLEQAAHVLDLLARAHLIQPSGPGRQGLHDLLRGYARRLAAAEDTEEERRAALTRLFDFYLRAAHVAMDVAFPAERHQRPGLPSAAAPVPPLADAVAAGAWLDAERDTLIEVAAYTATRGWPGHTVRLAATLASYLDAGRYYEAIIIHGYASQAARHSGDSGGEAVALTNLGLAAGAQGRYQQAIEHNRRALALFRAVGDQAGEASALNGLGGVERQLGRYPQARDHLRRALALCQAAGDTHGEARALSSLGVIDRRQGRYQQATEHQQRALALFRHTGDRVREAETLFRLGVVDLHQGGSRQAAAHLRQALTLFHETGDRSGQAEALKVLGDVDLARGRYQRASEHHYQALALFREIGDLAGETDVLNGLGRVSLALGQLQQARSQHAAALSLASRIGEEHEQANAHHGLGHVYQATGDLSQARWHWQQALTLYTSLGAPETDQVRAQLASLGSSLPADPAPPD